MEKKGLCDTCENDKGCTFRTRFPILQCEEFTNSNSKVIKMKQPKQKKGRCLQEITTEE